MVYAISGLGTDAVASNQCSSMPSSPDARSGLWAELKEAYGCPVRIYPFWFFPEAPIAGSNDSWFLIAATEEQKRAQQSWRTEYPTDWYTPPYTIDYSQPDINSETQKVVPSKFWESVPVTNIPCQCEASPDFGPCRDKAMQSVTLQCNGDAECIKSNFANLTVMTQCAQHCKSVPCKDGTVSPQDAQLLEEIKKSQSKEAKKARTRTAMYFGLAGITAYFFWKKQKKRK